MIKKITLILSVTAVLALGGVHVYADSDDNLPPACPAVYDEESGTWTAAYICDGRLNSFDLTAPVAVYYRRADVPEWVATTDEDGETVYEQRMTQEISAISVWAIDGNGVGQEAMLVPMSEVSAAIASGASTLIAQQNGITLGYSASGYLYIATLGGYTFAWEL